MKRLRESQSQPGVSSVSILTIPRIYLLYSSSKERDLHILYLLFSCVLSFFPCLLPLQLLRLDDDRVWEFGQHVPVGCVVVFSNICFLEGGSTLREERKLRAFESMVLRRIFGPRRDEVTGEWRRLYGEELNDLYPSPNIVGVIKSRRMRWVGHLARMGEESGVYRVLVGKPEGRRPLGRPRCRWANNISMGPQEVGCGYMDWIGLAQDRDRWRTLVSAVMNLRVP